MADKRKREVRDIQARTDWGYQFTKYLCSALGYEAVSSAVDGVGDPTLLRNLGRELNEKAKVAIATRASQKGGDCG